MSGAESPALPARGSVRVLYAVLILLGSALFGVSCWELVSKALELMRISGEPAAAEIALIAAPFVEAGLIVGGVLAVWRAGRREFASLWASVLIVGFLMLNALIWVYADVASCAITC